MRIEYHAWRNYKKSLLVLIVLLIVTVSIVYLFGNEVIWDGVEKSATDSIGREVQIGNLLLDPFTGRIGFGGMKLQNVEGYEFPRIITLKRSNLK